MWVATLGVLGVLGAVPAASASPLLRVVSAWWFLSLSRRPSKYLHGGRQRELRLLQCGGGGVRVLEGGGAGQALGGVHAQ
jgi:hypothetical protein